MTYPDIERVREAMRLNANLIEYHHCVSRQEMEDTRDEIRDLDILLNELGRHRDTPWQRLWQRFRKIYR